MPERAHVTSVDALESFRSNLILYRSKARPTLEEISAEVMRARLWLTDEKRRYWESELRRCTKKHGEAQQALFSASLTQLREVTAAERMAVHKAKHQMEEAEAKLRIIKKWDREFDSRVGPLVKQLQSLDSLVTNDLTQGIAYLTEAIKTLSAYSESSPASASDEPTA